MLKRPQPTHGEKRLKWKEAGKRKGLKGEKRVDGGFGLF
jgi:hypothetical protein